MKPLFPVFCRPFGYFVIALALFLPFLMMMAGRVSDANFLFYRECSKLLMMVGALLIIFALSRDESAETERIRNRAVCQAMFITMLFILGGMMWRVYRHDLQSVDSSTFLIFLIWNVICLEFGLKKHQIGRHIRQNRRKSPTED